MSTNPLPKMPLPTHTTRSPGTMTDLSTPHSTTMASPLAMATLHSGGARNSCSSIVSHSRYCARHNGQRSTHALLTLRKQHRPVSNATHDDTFPHMVKKSSSKSGLWSHGLPYTATVSCATGVGPGTISSLWWRNISSGAAAGPRVHCVLMESVARGRQPCYAARATALPTVPNNQRHTQCGSDKHTPAHTHTQTPRCCWAELLRIESRKTNKMPRASFVCVDLVRLIAMFHFSFPVTSSLLNFFPINTTAMMRQNQ